MSLKERKTYADERETELKQSILHALNFCKFPFPPQYSKSPFCIITEYFNAALTAVTELERTLPLEHHKCMNSIESNPNLSAG